MATIRPAVREAIEAALERELTALLGASRYARVASRLGYRNGVQVRALGTPLGAIPVAVPRARVQGAPERLSEWRRAALPRYARTERSGFAVLIWLICK